MKTKKETGDYINLLEKIEKVLPSLLDKPELWKSLFVNYEHPYVERLWTEFEDFRISLHAIHPCTREEVLYHPHPWPSGMKILKGRYEMGVGYGKGEEYPSIACTIVLNEGDEYEMIDPDGWHYVRPLENLTYTLMVTGKPWDRFSPKSDYKLSSLNENRKKELIELFKSFCK